MPDFFQTGMGKMFYEGLVPRIASALERIATAIEENATAPALSTDQTASWENDSVQFPRLIAEIKGVGLSSEQVQELCTSMDLKKEDIYDLLERAEATWEDIKSRVTP